ncbi:MAG: hypothetical protein JJE51_12945 [Thermoanaerobaculia bacterium]|nr:hypothetical protein [Thermoanaerobaculia bacterium]
MTFPTRLILIATLFFAVPSGISAQEAATASVPQTMTATATQTETSTSTADENQAGQSSYEIRTQFAQLLRQSPSELSTILVLDPTLLSNEGFLVGYPELARFVARHPEVRRNPRFYLEDFHAERQGRTPLEEIVEVLSILGVIATIAFTLAWLLRTIIEQKRWSRLSRTQSEVHNKILDRFGSSEELLAYIKTPAGTKFLESAPIPLRTEQPMQNAPLTRIMWSVQLGVIILAGGLGMLLVSLRFEKDTAEGFFAIGAIAASVGAGFIASAFTSIILSRRLGLWRSPGSLPAESLDEPGGMR